MPNNDPKTKSAELNDEELKAVNGGFANGVFDCYGTDENISRYQYEVGQELFYCRSVVSQRCKITRRYSYKIMHENLYYPLYEIQLLDSKDSWQDVEEMFLHT